MGEKKLQYHVLSSIIKKQARKLQATLVSKLCRLTDSLTDGGEVQSY